MYIADLIKRMRSKELLPQSGPFRTSADSVSFQALREAEKLSELSHLGEVQGLVMKAKTNRDIIHLARVVCYLYKNTGAEEVRQLYSDLCRKEKLTSECVMYLMDYATRAKFVELLPFVRQWLDWTPKSDVHYPEAIDFLAMALGKEALHELGSHLDNDCFGRADPVHCIFALEGLNEPAAVPYFQRFIERHKKGRKDWERDGVGFCMGAIEHLSKQAEPAAPPNGGPATPLGNSGALGGPPSVS